MSFAEILDEVDRLTLAERDRLAAQLRLQKELRDQSFTTEMERDETVAPTL